MSDDKKKDNSQLTRRKFLAGLTAGAAALTIPAGKSEAYWLEELFRQHYKRLDKEDLKDILAKLEEELTFKYGKKTTATATPPMDDTVFGYALDLSRCIGCRRCVYACVQENNLSRDPEIHWIKVLEFENNNKKWQGLEHSNKYYEPKKVPEKGKNYVPVQCQQCEKPPCVKVCPVQATWQEDDGIVVVDYNWCIGCRFCMAACPYGARNFNWGKPNIPKEEFNPHVHYLGNRPQYKGVVGKCTFCIQRSREGRYTACVEACPVGARKFGNLMDPNSEIRYILEHSKVFRLKEEIDTKPKFFYFFSMGTGVKS
ncbi:MAG: 4Fe-4S dicluster domain-containing protein [Nitrospira sp.]|nr:4Fe-4S dicluster domain-containing protein [Nitrospira sp.]